MALQITEQRNAFMLQGAINQTTSKSFMQHFEFLLQLNNELTIDINNVHEIDSDGMDALKALYGHALVANKKFNIVGYGCKEIYDEFRYKSVA